MIHKRGITASLAALSMVMLQGCATAGTAVESVPVVEEVPPPGAVPGPALWKVSDEDTTIYLFGTVHALPKDVEWMDERISRAFTRSDTLITEVDMAEAKNSAQSMAAAGLLPDGQNLREMMNEEDRLQFEAALAGLGLPAEAFDRLEPWFAAMTLSLLPVIKGGYDPNSGVENALNLDAEGKERGALETIAEQVELFDGLPMENQLDFLDQSVEAVPRAAQSLGAMVEQWLEGDAVELAELLNAELTDSLLHARLLTDRNANWAVWIDERLDAPGTVFVAVGAGHLAGEGSVQDALRDRGLHVTRIWQ